MASSKPKFLIFAGANGVGKSTLYHMQLETSNMPRINVDEIARGLGDWKDFSVMLQAGKEALKLQEKCLTQKISFNQETTLCGHLIKKAIRTAKDLDYFIEIHYIGVESVEICKERIQKRMFSGGHGIPDADIERRFLNSFSAMKNLLDQCDEINFYDNTKSLVFLGSFSNGCFTDLTNHNLPKWFRTYFQNILL